VPVASASQDQRRTGQMEDSLRVGPKREIWGKQGRRVSPTTAWLLAR
jgi:hypothetical protein